MLCSKCNKNTAVVFLTKIENGKSERVGLCMQCALEQGISPMNQMLQANGLNPEELENINEQMAELFEDPEISESLNTVIDKLSSSDNGAMNNLLSAFAGGKAEDAPFNDSKDDDKKVPDTKETNTNNILGSLFGNKSGTTTKTKKTSKNKLKNLENFGINLTVKAKEGKIDRIIGRDREVDRVIQILNRRQKNNPVLIGEPGVGKTAIAEGLATRIVEGKVPLKLLDSQIYLLDLTALVAGTQFRGQFEGRMKGIINEAKSAGNVILVIDEVHNIASAGDTESGSMNAANILKPALARGEVQIIGATTLDEYRKYIEKDSALERRFQPVLVDEPSINESIEIINGIKDYYEDYHKVIISEEIVNYAVVMSERYISDRFLPDKAIDVIDEAGSRANLKNKGLVELESLKKQLNKVIGDKEEAAAEDNFEKAAELRVSELNLTKQIDSLQEDCDNVEITKEDIAYVIEAWTKIPVANIKEEEKLKLINLENRLKRRVKGQDEAISSIAKTIRRNRAGFKKQRKPSSFIFVGPTGVGKTELTKALSEELFGNEDSMIRFDMSEFMEKHTVSKLIGAPPGYVGYQNAGQLTEKVRRKPYSVILLDEIEKAHQDVYNLLLQILEDGRLTDSQGRVVNFENAIIIMTSNAGTSTKSSTIGFNNESIDAKTSAINDALKTFFRPEFLNRVDETIIFKSLTKNVLFEIVDIMLEDVIEQALSKKISIQISDDVKNYLVNKGYDTLYGARPLRRAIDKYIEDKISEDYINGNISDGDSIILNLESDEIVLYKK